MLFPVTKEKQSSDVVLLSRIVLCIVWWYVGKKKRKKEKKKKENTFAFFCLSGGRISATVITNLIIRYKWSKMKWNEVKGEKKERRKKLQSKKICCLNSLSTWRRSFHSFFFAYFLAVLFLFQEWIEWFLRFKKKESTHWVFFSPPSPFRSPPMAGEGKEHLFSKYLFQRYAKQRESKIKKKK